MIDLTACPECGEAAEVLDRAVLASTDGPIEHARILCVRNHGFFMAVESLTLLPAPAETDPVVRRRGAGW